MRRVLPYIALLIALLGARLVHGDPSMMLNLAGFNDWTSGRPLVNLALLSRPAGTLADPYGQGLKNSLNAYGWPTQDFSTCIVALDYPDDGSPEGNTYMYSHAGSGTVTFLAGMVPGSQTATTVQLHGNVGGGDKPGTIVFKVTGINAADPFRDFKILCPGEDASYIFTAAYKQNFRGNPKPTIRIMEAQKINVMSHPFVWAKRASLNGPQTRDDVGCSPELVIALANETGCNLWISVPHSMSDVDVTAWAQTLKAGLRPEIQIDVEESNELWNGNFPQAAATLALAKADPTLTNSDPNGRQYEWAISSLRRHVGLFRAVLGADRVWGKLAGQGVVPWRQQQGLDFGMKRWGKVNDFIRGLAFNSYWNATFTVETSNPTFAQFVASCETEINDVDTWMYDEQRKLCVQYGIVDVDAYEGGQAVVDQRYSDSGQLFNGNHDLHEQFERSQDCGRLTAKDVQQFWAKGGAKYGHFFGVPYTWGLKNDPTRGRYGYWAPRESMTDSTPKSDALFGLLGVSPPSTPTPIPPTPISPPPSPPTTNPTTQPTTQPLPRPAKTVIIDGPWGHVEWTPNTDTKIGVR